MATIDEQVREYMRGYYEGTRMMHLRSIHFRTPEGETEPDFRRGYAAGRAAFKTAEQVEHERIERNTAPNIDDEECHLLEQQRVVQAAGHYSRRTGVRLSLAAKIMAEWNGRDA